MSVIRAAVLSAAVSLAAVCAAPAMTVADLGHGHGVAAPAEFSFGDEIAPGRAARVDSFDAAAARNYFDYDALVTLGALALAGGALAAFSVGAARRRKAADDVEPAWRQSVMHAVQADLAQFTATLRRAA
jgi:hypothetical protein